MDKQHPITLLNVSLYAINLIIWQISYVPNSILLSLIMTQ